MSAALARPVQLRGPELRPESRWEYISYPGGVYAARRVPVAELTVGEEPAVIVLFTHDWGLAARVAGPLWCAEQGGGLTRPVRRWWRRVPVEPATVEPGRLRAHVVAGAARHTGRDPAGRVPVPRS